MHGFVAWLRSWRLVSWRTAVVAAFVGYGMIGFFVAPRVAKVLIIDIVGERTGRDVEVGEVLTNPFSLSLTVRDFSIADRPGTTVVSFDELHANAQLSSLLRWAATLKELRVENPSLGIRRFPDGGVNVLEILEDLKARSPSTDPAESGGGLPRVLLQNVLASGGVLLIEDYAREEPLVWRHGLSRFELHDIGTLIAYRGDHDLEVGLERGGSIRVEGEVDVEPLGLEGSVAMERIDLAGMWDALRPFFDFDFGEGELSGTFSYSVRLAEDGPQVLVSGVDFRGVDIEVTAGSSEETILRVGSLGTFGISAAWPEARVRGDSIVVDGAEALQWIRPDGTPSWDQLVPEETQERVVEIYREVEAAFPWDLALGRLEFRNSTARIEDRTFPEPLEIVVEDVGVELTDFATGPDRRWGLAGRATVMREGAVRADGFVRTAPMGLEAEVALENIVLPRAQPYLERIGPFQLRSGVLQATGTGRVSAGGEEPKASFTGDVAILDVDLWETVRGTPLLGWNRVEARGVDAGLRPTAVEVASVDVAGARAEIVVSEQGEISLLEVLAAMSEDRGSDGGSEDEGSRLPPIVVDEITLVGGSASISARSVVPTLILGLDSVGGTVSGLVNDGSGGAFLDLEGTVASGGWAGVQGEIDLFGPKRLADLQISVRRVHLPPVSPVSVRLIGHPIEEGDVDLSLDYEVVSSELTGENRIVTHGLVLGEKVQGEGKVNLPFKLGVSLLTDREGLITLEFPVAGDLEDPEFGLSSAVGSAALAAVTEVVESPFRLLGRLAGSPGEADLGFVEFAHGDSELRGPAVETLGLLAGAASERPELVLVVRGTWDPEADALRLSERAVERRLGDEPPTLTALEAMVEASVGGAIVDSLREEHVAPDPETGEPVLDEKAYERSLRAALVEAQSIDPDALRALASARAEAVRAFLMGDGGLDPARVRIADPVAVGESSSDRWVRTRIEIAASG